MSYKAIVIILSEVKAKGVEEKKEAPDALIREMLPAEEYEIETLNMAGCPAEELKKTLIDICDNKKANLILTTGGSGLTKRDSAPEATQAVLEHQLPGIAEAIRAESMKQTPRGMLYRGVSGTRADTLIVNLPGKSWAVKESFEVIFPVVTRIVEFLAQA